MAQFRPKDKQESTSRPVNTSTTPFKAPARSRKTTIPDSDDETWLPSSPIAPPVTSILKRRSSRLSAGGVCKRQQTEWPGLISARQPTDIDLIPPVLTGTDMDLDGYISSDSAYSDDPDEFDDFDESETGEDSDKSSPGSITIDEPGDLDVECDLSGADTLREENTARFRKQMGDLIQEMHTHVDVYQSARDHGGSGKAAVSKGTFKLFKYTDSSDLANTILQHIPQGVQAVLGKRDLTVHDLKGLPRWDYGTDDWGCYLGLSCRKITRECSVEFPNNVAHGPTDNQRTEVGVYVGSSTNSKGGVTRRHHRHMSVINRGRHQRANPNERTRHYNFTGRHGTHTDWFELARFQLPMVGVPKSYVMLVEGLMMAYLNTVYAGSRMNPYNNTRTRSLVQNIRRSVPELPDIQRFGLNSAWALMQLTEDCTGAGYCDHCGIPNCERKGSSTLCTTCQQLFGDGSDDNCAWCGAEEPLEIPVIGLAHTGVGSRRRCAPCRRYKRRNKMWPPPECWSTNNRGCHNCGAAEGSFTTIGTPREFYFTGVERRCKTCLAYRNIHGKESPGLAMRIKDGCKDCGLEEGALRSTGNPMVFYGFGDTRLCDPCYQKKLRNQKQTEPAPCVICGVKYGTLSTTGKPLLFKGHGTTRLCYTCLGNRKHANDDGCKRCGASEGTLTSTGSRLVFHGLGDGRLCANCYNKKIPKKEDTVKDGCKRCGAPEGSKLTRNGSLMPFFGSGEARRCRSCQAVENRGNVNPPKEPMVKNGCSGCGLAEGSLTRTGRPHQFVGSGNARLCKTCYNAAKRTSAETQEQLAAAD